MPIQEEHADIVVYLATPYSHPDAMKRDERYRQSIFLCGHLLRQGISPYSPICHSHPIADAMRLPFAYDYWRQLDERFIRACDCVCVAQMDGWHESVGIQSEVALAESLDIPVYHFEIKDFPNGHAAKQILAHTSRRLHPAHARGHA